MKMAKKFDMSSIESYHKPFFCFLTLLFIFSLLSLVSPASAANWWDKFGEPEYGGDITTASMALWDQIDPLDAFRGRAYMLWNETLFAESWTVNKDEFPAIRSNSFTLDEYIVGQLAVSWEWKDPQTLILHLRQGVHWQDKPPVNGREFTADDVVYHYQRQLGIGGFTKGSPFAMGFLGGIASVNATDKYTVVFNFKSSRFTNFLALRDAGFFNMIEAKESVEAGLTDWHNTAGTGPWILTDWVSGSSVTYGKNPNYWGYDERHPKNRLPYTDMIKLLIIPDSATRLAALRANKLDVLFGEANVDWKASKALANTNAEIQQSKAPFWGVSVLLRVDHKPFTDIRVRRALQMSIDRPIISKSYYGGTADSVAAGFLNPTIYKHVAIPYNQWPKDLQDEYSYNPERAKQLLAEAGYPKGFKTNIVASSELDLQLLQAIKSYFMDIGVDMEIRSMDPPTANALVNDLKYDQMASGSFAPPFPPIIAVASFAKGAFGSFGKVVNDPHYNSLYDQFNKAPTEEEAYKVLSEANLYALTQNWTVNTVPYYGYNVWHPHLKGYDGEMLGWGVGRYLARFWIDQNE